MRVVVIGGGWAGCAAAVGARKAGADVMLIERTDMLLGTGLVGGIMRNNGRYTAAEEMIAMGGGDLFEICDHNARHKNIEFAGHKHASLYDIASTHGQVLTYLKGLDIKIFFETRIDKVKMQSRTIAAVQGQQEQIFEGDVFIDASGTAGPVKNCVQYGNGCAMCIIRCPSFGGRVSITKLAGVDEYIGKKPDGSYGAMSGSCKLHKESLSKKMQELLHTTGVVVIPIPKKLMKADLEGKACQQYALKAFQENIILLDTGHAKLMAPYYDIELLRQIPGFENVRYEDPYAGGKGNSIRYIGMAPRDNYMKVEGVDNLFCCGEKAGLLVGHTEAIATGTLAGYNSVRFALKKHLFEIPTTLAVGDAIVYVKENMTTKEGMTQKYTFSGSVYFERMKKLGFYTTEIDEISERVEHSGASNIFVKKIT